MDHEPLPNMEVEQDVENIRLVKSVDFSRVTVQITRINSLTGLLTINEWGFPPHCHAVADLGQLIQHVSFAMHRATIAGMSDAELVSVNVDVLKLDAVTDAKVFIAMALHPSTNRETQQWEAQNVQ